MNNQPRKKKKKQRTANPRKRKRKKQRNSQPKKKKKKKKKEQPTQEKEKKKSKVVKSCGWNCLRVPHVFLIKKMPLSYELWKLKTAKMCFQFP